MVERQLKRPRLPHEFYARPTLEVARNLLGQRLVRVLDGRRLAGRIVETEAYIGEDDLASHASRGRTPRTDPMFGPPGYAYVYFIYGMYYCLNVVTEPEGVPAAVLVRAIEPLEGMEVMRQRRPGQPDADLANGPGKLCQALAIDLRLNRSDMVAGSALFIESDDPVDPAWVLQTPRVGVRGDRLALERPWRFVVK